MNGKCIGKVFALVLACLSPAVAVAQDRGRTDGPEGSEYGKGGYSEPGGGLFSLALDWGGSFGGGPLSGVNGAPLFAGVTATFWMDEWFVLDLSPSYLVNSSRVNVLVGPRFRTMGYPISFSAGLQAGPIIDPDTGVRFGLSPRVGLEGLLSDHYLMGLNYALDVPLGGDGANHRVFMTLGYRF